MKYPSLFKSLLAALLLAIPALLSAAPVSRQHAQAIATTFMQQRGMASAAPKLTYRMPAKASDSYYYVFNAGQDKGFVIVSGDDRTQQVLGYSDKGSLDMDNVPTNIRAFLQTYADEIKRLDDAGASSTLPAVIRKAEKVKYPVSPLLRTQWNQDTPFNNNCPVINGSQTVTGCVATATAQAMAYFRWPANTTAAIPSYTSTGENLGSTTLSGVAAGTSLGWGDIVDDYSGTTTTAQQNAVANLMLYVGESVQMNYNTAENGGSGALQSAIVPALTTYFDYSAHNLDRTTCTLAQFEDSLFNEVANSRPVIFCGSSSGGGHCFIIDGYDGEGLFHVNWGWGGMADGYFLLSVLNPDNNSGIGASTTSDGYSMDQCAVIGMEKGSGKASGGPAKMTVYDQSVSNNTVTLSAYNLSGEAHNFDIAVVSIADDGTTTSIETLVNDYKIENGYGFTNYSFPLSELDLSAGTYHITLASKVSGTSEWLYDEKDVIEVTVDESGNIVSAKIASDVNNLSITNWEPVGTLSAGTQQSVKITLANSGSEFYGTVYLFASQNSNKGNIQSQTGLTATAHGSTTIQMSFKPSNSGTYTLWLCSDANGNNVIGSTTVSVSAASSGTNYNLSSSYNPSDGSTIYGKNVEGVCTISNSGSDAYNGTIYTAVFDSNNNNVGQASQQVSIPAGGSVDVPFSYEEPAGQYIIGAFNLTSSSYQQIGDAIWLTLADAIIAYKADGTKMAQAVRSTVVVGSDIAALDLSGVDNTVTTVDATNANPNALFYFSSADAPAAVSLKADGRNVIIGSTADNLTITDSNDFYCPTAFTATNATYTRTATSGTNGNGGWETICLPFEASAVSANGQALHWFTSTEDKGRDFWLMEFSELDGNSVVFDFNTGSTLKANTPYIIAVPDSHWGEQYNLVGKPMSFSGTNVEVKATAKAKILISTSAYNFIGSTVATNTANDFLMNNGGTAFARTASATSAPFRAFFRAKGDTSSQPQLLKIRVHGGTATGITSVNLDENSNRKAPAYNLAGQRVGKGYKGIVIKNGKKVIAK